MKKIGIELNGVIRNINQQYLKYYLKDINPTFDDTDIDLNVNDFLKQLKFENKSDIEKFVYEDYPYEIFGCAAPMSRNLHTFLNGWAHELEDEYEIGFFSFGEKELSIQSTYFYLSKSGSRVRRALFPKNVKDLYNEFDIIITSDEKIALSKPKDKICVLIEKTDNKSALSLVDKSYNNLEDLMKDSVSFKEYVENYSESNIFVREIKKVLYKIKKFLNGKR